MRSSWDTKSGTGLDSMNSDESTFVYLSGLGGDQKPWNYQRPKKIFIGFPTMTHRRKISQLCLYFLPTLLLICVPAPAQSSAPHADSTPASEAEVKTLISKMAETIIKADWDAYAQHLAPDYIGTSFTGQVENKDEALARLRDPQHNSSSWTWNPASASVSTLIPRSAAPSSPSPSANQDASTPIAYSLPILG